MPIFFIPPIDLKTSIRYSVYITTHGGFVISYHPNKKDVMLQEKYAWGWRWYSPDDIDVMARIIKTFANSPIIWAGGRRRKVNFVRCNWIALDFDNGVFLKDILYKVKDMVHIVGTTKRHQMRKENGLKWDRFRVWLKLEKEITSLVEYEECMMWYAKKWNSDLIATNGSTKFLPCKEIISINKEGKLVPIERYVINIQKVPYKDFSAEKKTMPTFIKDFLSNGVPEGSKDLACFKCGLHLTRCGYSVEQIIDMIMSSPIPINQSSQVQREVRRAVLSGSKHTR